MRPATRIVRIDGATIDSAAALYGALKRELELPPHAGANLDALWDALTRDVPGPVLVEITDAPALRRRLGEAGARVLDLLAEVVAERDDFAVALRD